MDCTYTKLNHLHIGMFSWNPKKQNYIELDKRPGKLHDIKALNESWSKNPFELKSESEVPNKLVDFSKPPYGYCYAVPLYAALQYGCRLENINFLISGQILPSLCLGLWENPTKYILVQLRKGILILRSMQTEPYNLNSVGLQIEALLTENKTHEEFSSPTILREISIGKFRVLVNAQVDAINEDEEYCEIKQSSIMSKTIEKGKMEKSAVFRSDPMPVVNVKKLCIQMISNGAKILVHPKMNISHEGFKPKYKISGTHSYSIDEVIEKADSLSKEYGNEETVDDILKHALQTLKILQEYVDAGNIRSNPRCFYELRINNWSTEENGRVSIKPLEKERLLGFFDTSEFMCQKLYDSLNDPMKEDDDVFLQNLRELYQGNSKISEYQRDRLLQEIENANKVYLTYDFTETLFYRFGNYLMV